jgi:hypothetical protein
VSPNQVYFLHCCKNKIIPTKIINIEGESLVCQQKGLITKDGLILPKGVEILNDFEAYIIKSKKKLDSEVLGPNGAEKVKKYREMFPEGRFPSKELARQNVEELKTKFVWFFQTFPEYTWDLVFDATDYYLYVKGLVDYQYAVTSSYFIKKTDKYSKEIKSVLADYCQELLDNPDLKNH